MVEEARVTRDFDYVIIGAGSAGCVVAHRLSADPDCRVLLLEAGPKDRGAFLKMPAAFSHVIASGRYNWCYASEPEPFLNDRRIPCPRGRVLGGSSSINAMAFVRGHRVDFDGWAESGLESWSYAHCLPYFKNLERFSGDGDAQLTLDAIIAAVLAFGFAIVAIAFLMAWLRRATFTPFAVYRLILGAGLLIWIYAF